VALIAEMDNAGRTPHITCCRRPVRERWLRDLEGDQDGLEDSQDCRSVGGHGNQHVRLRISQIRRAIFF
jgi:hypothetical protein